MTDAFVAYVRERFRLKIFGSAAVFHAAAALWATGTPVTPRSAFLAIGLALALLLQFRLWDDLEDLERDARDHPGRVLVRSDPVPFRFISMALAVANILFLATAGSPSTAISLIGLDAFFWIAYRTLRSHLPHRVWRFQILLIKYPVFVGLMAAAIGSPLSWRLVTASCAIYVGACAYETLHDRQLPLGATS